MDWTALYFVLVLQTSETVQHLSAINAVIYLPMKDWGRVLKGKNRLENRQPWMCFGTEVLGALCLRVRHDFLIFNRGYFTTGLMSTSRSNGQPQSWQAVNQSDYRKPLVQGYTIKSGNGLIKPATPQQTFWFCLLRAARSLGWVKIRKTFFFCALLPGVSCTWSILAFFFFLLFSSLVPLFLLFLFRVQMNALP